MNIFRTLTSGAVYLMLAAALLASSALAHDAPVENELHELLDAFLAGASTNDAEMHDRFWAEDLVYTSSAGERRGKREIMTGLAEASTADAGELPVYRGEDVDIRVFDDLAVITFRLVAEMPDDTTSEYFNTGVFAKRDGAWQAFTWQATRIPVEVGD
ncbi:MAG: nuclear transport factor 2 family protein [Wenzhouxiangellaceae bacterium]